MSNTTGTSPNTGDTVPIEAPTDEWGNTHQDLDKYPEGSAAREGKTTVPSGQGGQTPHDGTSYQDQFPPNPEPSAGAKAWGEYLREKAKAESEGREPPTAPTPEELSAAKPSKSKKSEAPKSTGP